jgi:hypothetical protein
MKIIISESQYNLILEQKSDKAMDAQAKAIGTLTNSIDKHTLMTILAIGSVFIPVVGPFISAGIGLADAGMYYQEGDSKSAGLTAVLSMLPFVGSIVTKIPGVKQLGVKGMAAFASKLSSGSKLTKGEYEIAIAIKNNQGLINSELKSVSSVLSNIKVYVDKFRPSYIQRFGQQKYDELLQNLLSKKITKEEFIQSLKTSQKATPELSNFATKYGIKFTNDELYLIKRTSDGILNGKESQIMLVNTKNGLKKINVFTSDFKNFIKRNPNFKGTDGFVSGDNIFLNKNLIQNFDSQRLQELIGHELAHIKDPAMVSSKLKSTYGTGVKNYNLHPFEVNAVTSASLQNLTNTAKSWMKYLPKEQLIGYLDDIIRYTKGEKLFDTNSLKMIGQDGLDQLVLYYKNDKKVYRDLLTKLAKQANYLISQVNIAM